MTALYIETNFLMRIAQGQEPGAQQLLNSPPAGLQIYIPAPCCMEAFSTIKRYRSKWNFIGKETIGKEIKDLRTNFMSPYATQLVKGFNQAVIDSQDLVNDSQARLFSAMHDLIYNAEIVSLTKTALLASIDTAFIDDPTDNLILHCILEHARTLSTRPNALITNNTHDFRTLGILRQLYDSGEVYFFADTRSFDGWFMNGCKKKPRP